MMGHTRIKAGPDLLGRIIQEEELTFGTALAAI